MSRHAETGDPARPRGAEDAEDARPEHQRRLDHLFRHALKDERVSPLYFLLQRFRSRPEEGA